MTPLPWFRLHTEFATDPVVQTLAFEDQRHFIMLLCFKASGLLDRDFGNPQARLDCIRKTLGLDGKAWDEMRERLVVVGLIDGNLQPVNWSKRQYLSDNSTDRVRAYRAKKKEETPCNGDETLQKRPQRQRTETETEKDVVPTVLGGNTVSTQPPPTVDKAYKLPACPYSEIVAAYHERLPVCPRVEVLSEQRKRHLQARWRQVCADEKLTREQGIEWFDDFFANVAKSQFLTGKTKPRDGRRPFFASLDWLMSAEKFVHVYEGKYS